MKSDFRLRRRGSPVPPPKLVLHDGRLHRPWLAAVHERIRLLSTSQAGIGCSRHSVDHGQVDGGEKILQKMQGSQT